MKQHRFSEFKRGIFFISSLVLSIIRVRNICAVYLLLTLVYNIVFKNPLYIFNLRIQSVGGRVWSGVLLSIQLKQADIPIKIAAT